MCGLPRPYIHGVHRVRQGGARNLHLHSIGVSRAPASPTSFSCWASRPNRVRSGPRIAEIQDGFVANTLEKMKREAQLRRSGGRKQMT